MSFTNTITAKEAGTDFEHYLAATREGERFIIPLNEEPVATLVPVWNAAENRAASEFRRPKVGETMDLRMKVPESAFAPMSESELELWHGA